MDQFDNKRHQTGFESSDGGKNKQNFENVAVVQNLKLINSIGLSLDFIQRKRERSGEVDAAVDLALVSLW